MAIHEDKLKIMIVQNKAGRNYNLAASKGNVMANWTTKEKAVRMDIGGEKVDVFANTEKSNYIYLRHNGTVYCVWAKDPKEFDFLKEKSLKIISASRTRTKKAATAAPAVTKPAAKKAAKPVVKDAKRESAAKDAAAAHANDKKQRQVKVTKKADLAPQTPPPAPEASSESQATV